MRAINEGRDKELSRKVLYDCLHRLEAAGLIDGVGVIVYPRRAHYWITRKGREVVSRVARVSAERSRRVEPEQLQPRPRDIDAGRAYPARVWNYWLGGNDNFAVDREAGNLLARAMPTLPALARAGRTFQADATRELLGRGVRQFLDIGTGIPAYGGLHDIVQDAAPDARILYVDNDPQVVAHARALLTGGPGGKVDYLQADLRDPAAILSQAGQTFDQRRPVAVMMLGVLHHLGDGDDPWSIAARLVAGVTEADRYLVISHGAADIRPAEAAEVEALYNARIAAQLRLRTRAEVARFFDGMDMLDPGVVPLGQWLATDPARVEDLPGYVGIGWYRA